MNTVVSELQIREIQGEHNRLAELRRKTFKFSENLAFVVYNPKKWKLHRERAQIFQVPLIQMINTKQCMNKVVLHKNKQGATKQINAGTHKGLGDI